LAHTILAAHKPVKDFQRMNIMHSHSNLYEPLTYIHGISHSYLYETLTCIHRISHSYLYEPLTYIHSISYQPIFIQSILTRAQQELTWAIVWPQ